MIIEPKTRGFICTTAHPLGCALNVEQQMDYVKLRGLIPNAPKKVLVIGASTGYGLASRIVAAFGGKAETIGVFYEKPAKGRRTASSGWYNSAALERAAKQQGLYARSINGDAFSDEVKQQVIDLINKDWGGGVDLVIYSLAAPRRIDPKTQAVYTSCLKTQGQPVTSQSIDLETRKINTITIGSASEQEIEETIKVMGGEDWQLWVEALLKAQCFNQQVTVLAYSYIGPELTHAIYRNGTIGAAKKHLEATTKRLNEDLASIQGHAYISVNKALVTQAAAAIPLVPLYTSILYQVMKTQGTHEGCIEQMERLFRQKLYSQQGVITDHQGLIRMDDWEMQASTQKKVIHAWQAINSDNLLQYADITGYQQEFLKLFGFGVKGVDYTADTDIDVAIPSLREKE